MKVAPGTPLHVSLHWDTNDIQPVGRLAYRDQISPTRNAELMRWCLSNGLKIVQPMSLMSRGSYQTPKGAFIPSVIF
jgi:hypothetical protein